MLAPVEYGSSSRLLERDAELALTTSLLERTPAGDGALLAVVGPAGIGKTRLLAETRRTATDRGFTVLAARAAELEHDLAFGIVRQLFEPALARASEAERAELLAGSAALAAPLTGAPLPAGPDPLFSVLHGLHWLTANLAGRGPLLLAIDDAQWADAPSLRFLAYLAARLGGTPALVMLTVRPPAAGNLVDAVLADPECHVLRPKPLSEAAVGTLVSDRMGAAADDEFVAACATASGGNPFLVVELLAALAADNLPPTRASTGQVLALGPATVTRSVLARLARMGPDCVALARAVAVLGEDADLDRAATLAGVGTHAAAQAADALTAADVFRRDRRPAFVHPIVRAAVYEDILPQERAAAHARAARLLAEPAVVGAHLLLAPPAGDPWVVAALQRAAAGAAAAPESAVAYLDRALAEPPPPEQESAIVRALGAAELAAGNPRALEHLAAAHDELADPAARALVALDLARAYMAAGRPDGVALLQHAADDVRDAEPGLAARLDVEATGIERGLGFPPEARRRELRALQATVPAGDAAGRLVRAGLAFEVATEGTSAAEAAALAEEAFGGGRLLAEEGPESPNVIMAANALSFCDRFDQARAILDSGLAAARERGSALGVAFCSCFLSALALRVGAVQEAEALAREALALTGSPILAVLRPIALSFLADALVERGELAEAEQALDGAAPPGLNAMFMQVTRGWVRLQRGDPERGLDELVNAGERLVAAGVTNAVPTFWRSRAALAGFALGDAERAAALAGEELAAARRFGAPSPIGIALRAAGVVRGDEALLEQSVATLASTPAQLEHAHSLVALGSARRRGGRAGDAREPLASGLALARRCGAVALAERAYDELAATGARPRKIVRAGAEALTASERRAAEMAAAGMTNRDIAQALFVTVRTVETHLGRAYTKLDISSRAELATALTRSA